MRKHTILGVAAAAMLAVAPTASAAYWTVHSEVLQSIVENVIIKIMQHRDTQNSSSERATRPRAVQHEQTQRTPVKR
ncbi:hypothetical protein D6833_11560 [Candidatus Parcubacteria bacterium]|nr:MAG: hypothetical protein D6833_11560 [Candidatus Parcubacteria bacterium]